MKHMEEVGKGVVVYLSEPANEGMAAELATTPKHEHDGQQYFNKLDSKDRGIGAKILESRRPKHDAAQRCHAWATSATDCPFKKSP